MNHGVAGGTLSALGGGEFGHGFASAAATSLAKPLIKTIPSDSVQVLAAAIVGGTIAEASGGKFANGAVTSAFMWAYNHNNHPDSETSDGNTTSVLSKAEYERRLNKILGKLTATDFSDAGIYILGMSADAFREMFPSREYPVDGLIEHDKARIKQFMFPKSVPKALAYGRAVYETFQVDPTVDVDIVEMFRVESFYNMVVHAQPSGEISTHDLVKLFGNVKGYY